jgi:hypothetical protein
MAFIVTTIGKVGGATVPSAYAGLVSPSALTNAEIFSEVTK